jgi:hypothetical protein
MGGLGFWTGKDGKTVVYHVPGYEVGSFEGKPGSVEVAPPAGPTKNQQAAACRERGRLP